MKPFLKRLVSVLLLTVLYQAGNAQYTITANENWSATGAPSSCNGCTFTISSGVTFTLNTNGVTCVNCLFNGGIVVDNSTFSWQGGTFENDSVAFENSGSSILISGVGGPLFNNDKIEFNQPITCQACSFTGDAIHIDLPLATNEVTFQSSGAFTTTTVNSSTVTVNTGQWYANSTTSVTSSTLTFNNASILTNNTGTLTLSGSDLYLNSSSTINTSTGVVVENNSEIQVGDGTLASTASFNDNSGTLLQIKDNSLIHIYNQNNVYTNWGQYTYTPTSGASTNFTTTSLDLNCGASYVHSTASCNSNAEYVYGCATLNSAGAAACAVLAIADLDLTAMAAGHDAVALSWTDAQNSTADHYLIERSIGNNDWTTLTTVNANAYTNGDYQFEDQAAPAGTVDYRILRVGQDGIASWSAICTITIAGTRGTVSIYPNPMSGHTFFVTVPNTGQLVVKVFTLTGQLVTRTTLQGQTQYQVQLPAQVLPGTAVIVQIIQTEQTLSFPLLLR
jgi:hypothetical protein